MKITLKAARVNADFLQKEIAAELGVSISTIINWESGRTSVPMKQLLKLITFYKIPLDSIQW